MITTFLDTLPTAPSRTRPSDFSEESDNFLYAIVPFQSDINSMAVEINSTATDVNNDRAAALTSETNALAYEQIAMANANFKGQWSTLTGTLAIPASVEHDGKFWILLSDLSDVTAKEPGVDSEWRLVSLSVVGDILFSTLSEADMESRGYLPCDDGIYLQSAYPALYAKLGLQRSFPVVESPLPVLTGIPTDYNCTGNDDYIFVTITTSPYLLVIKKSDLSIVSGTPVISSTPGHIKVNSTHLFVLIHVSPYLLVYSISDWSLVSGTPTIPYSPISIAVNDDYVFVGDNTSPYWACYSTTGWGAVSIPAASIRVSSINIDTDYVYIGAALQILRLSDLTFITAPFSSTSVNSVSSDSTHIYYALSKYPYLQIVKKSDFSLVTTVSPSQNLTRIIVDNDFIYALGTASSGPWVLVFDKVDGSLITTVDYNEPRASLYTATDDDLVWTTDSNPPYISAVAKNTYNQSTEFIIPVIPPLGKSLAYNPFIKAE